LAYEEVIELVSQNDISTDFENKNDYNIQIFQPLSDEEINKIISDYQALEANEESPEFQEQKRARESIEKRLELLSDEGQTELDELVSQNYFGDTRISEYERILAVDAWLDENYLETKLDE
jgi:hypothetical protein